MITLFKRKRCKYCKRIIINLNSDWAKTGQCIFCYEAEERGRENEKNCIETK